MKKVSLFLGMVLSASMAMAQVASNTATIDQYGTNVAQIEQDGEKNLADINQGSLSHSVINSPANSQGNLYGSYVKQIGNENEALVDVSGSGNGTKIYQEGFSNYGKQDINANGSAGIVNLKMGVDLYQKGNDNSSLQTTVPSFGSSPVRLMYVDQQGNDNFVNQLSIGGSGNSQHVVQKGNNNNNPTKSGNSLDVSATGLNNPMNLSWAYGNQGGYSSTNDYTQYSNQMAGKAHIDIEGNDNNTFQFQESSWSNTANVATIKIAGNANDVIQGQKGNLNTSEIDVNGSGNVITSSQLGDHNTTSIELLFASDNNVVGVEQTGNWQDASVLQSGVSNFAKVIQQP